MRHKRISKSSSYPSCPPCIERWMSNVDCGVRDLVQSICGEHVGGVGVVVATDVIAYCALVHGGGSCACGVCWRGGFRTSGQEASEKEKESDGGKEAGTHGR